MVKGTKDLDNMQALNMLVQKNDEFNRESSKKGGGYFVGRVVLTLRLWNLKRASVDQTNSKVFWDKRQAHPSNPKDYGKTLEALSDKEAAVTLNNRNFHSDKATTIKHAGDIHKSLPGVVLGEHSQVPTGCI